MPYTALWLYNKLVECWFVTQWQGERDRYFPKMHTKDIQYLNSVNDALLLQYTVKRCEEEDNIFMFHCTTLQGSEVMNAVN